MRGRTPAWLYWLLQATCAFVLVSEAIGIFEVLAVREQLMQTVPGGYGVRLFLRPFVIGASVLFAWIRLFWPEREGARVAALGGGALLSVFSIVMWLNASVNDLDYPLWLSLGYPLAALVFFAYTVAGRERTGFGR